MFHENDLWYVKRLCSDNKAFGTSFFAPKRPQTTVPLKKWQNTGLYKIIAH
jgi:hypothetical protein